MSRIALLGSILFAAACAKSAMEQLPVPVVEAPPIEKPLFEVSFSNMLSFADANADGPGQAFVTIRKHDPDHGWVEWKKIQFAGERLGWMREDGKATSLHRVFSAKLDKVVKVDFDTKATLKKLVTEKIVVYESRQCPILKKVMVKCPGPSTVSLTYKVDEALVAWDSGKVDTFRKLSGPGPLEDALCPSHGGKGEPLKLSEEEVKALRTREAEELLWEADDGRLSRNPKVRHKARDAYRRLLREFASEKCVTDNLARIKARAEAEIED